MKNKYTVLGVILIFIASFLIFGSFSYNLNGNFLIKIGYIAIFIIGVVCVRKGKDK